MYSILKAWCSRRLSIKALSPPISHISKVGLRYSHQMKYCHVKSNILLAAPPSTLGHIYNDWRPCCNHPNIDACLWCERCKGHLFAKGSRISILRVVLSNRVCLLWGRLRRHLHTWRVYARAYATDKHATWMKKKKKWKVRVQSLVLLQHAVCCNTVSQLSYRNKVKLTERIISN